MERSSWECASKSREREGRFQNFLLFFLRVLFARRSLGSDSFLPSVLSIFLLAKESKRQEKAPQLLSLSFLFKQKRREKGVERNTYFPCLPWMDEQHERKQKNRGKKDNCSAQLARMISYEIGSRKFRFFSPIFPFFQIVWRIESSICFLRSPTSDAMRHGGHGGDGGTTFERHRNELLKHWA